MSYPHSGCLTIDLSAVSDNWRLLRGRLLSGECGAVVKADAYGLGMHAIAKALHQSGCRHFFVANVDEGVTLRRLLGFGSDIFVLQGVPDGAYVPFLQHRLVPVIISAPMFERWLRVAAGQAGAICALKVNTGMNRFGLELAELEHLMASPDKLKSAQVAWLMSHLACADTPLHPLNATQIHRFEQCLNALRCVLPDLRASLANSAGIFLDQHPHYDLVRPGIALYGGASQVGESQVMRPVVELKLPVVQVREMQRGEVVGYGAEYVTSDPTVAVVVSGGYADGVLRSLSGVGRAWFGDFLPLLGRVSMDSCVFDVTHLSPSKRPQEGDMIEILGPNLPIDGMAAQADTISYEILTRLGRRFALSYRS